MQFDQAKPMQRAYAQSKKKEGKKAMLISTYRQAPSILELSNETLIGRAPSIGATAPIVGVSDRYSFVPTIQAVNFLRDAGWLPVMCGESRVNLPGRAGYQKHLIRLSRPDLLVNGHRMDLLLYNSHDRGCSFRLVAGIFRFVCSNGLVVGDTFASYRHRHVGFSPDAFIDSAARIDGRIGRIASVIGDWQAVELTPDERGVFAMAAHQAIYPPALPAPGQIVDPLSDTAPIEPRQLLTARRYDDHNKADLWTAYNTIQENAIKGGWRGRATTGRRTSTRAVKSIDKDLRINQALWTLTSKMAELKGRLPRAA